MNRARCRAHSVEAADDQQRIVEPRRAPVADGEVGDGIGALARLVRGALVDPGGAHHVRPRALQVAQVIGVIDDPGEVGILEIDAQPEAVDPVHEAAGIRAIRILS